MPKSPVQGGTSSFNMARRVSSALTHNFSLITNYLHGYRNREDVTVLPPGILVQGSQNVLTNTFERIGIRKGYTLDGQKETDIAPILSSFDWQRHTGDTRHLKAGFLTTPNTGKLKFRYVATQDGENWEGNTFVKDQVFWIDLLTMLPSVSFNFTDYWDFTALQSLLLFVNGTSQIYEWSGGVAVLKSSSNAAGSIATFEQPGSVATVSVASGGLGYKTGDLLTLATGGQNAVVEVQGTDISGTVTAISLVDGGSGYTTGIKGTIGGSGEGDCSINITALNSDSGTGYVVGDMITISTGGGNATMEVTAITDDGYVKAIRLTNPGTGYSTGVKATTTSGAGTGVTIDITAVATGYIEKYGDKSWAEEGFYNLNPQKALVINGNVYTYTGGETTTFLVGISPDPTGEPLKSVIFQKLLVTVNSGIKDLPATLKNTLIANLKNQIYIADGVNNSVYVSRENNYKDFSFTTPVRMVGEGAILTLDGAPTSLIPQETDLYISAGKDQWYLTAFNLSADLASESLTINRLKTTARQAAQSQALTTKIKNHIAFTSFEPIVNTLGREPDILGTPITEDLSFSIVNDMNMYDFTDGSMAYNKQFLYVAIPRMNTVRIYNMTNSKSPYWEAPQILPISRFSIIDGELYGHSYQVGETYKLFNGTNDNGHAIEARATFSFNNYGTRAYQKNFNEYYVEGYITPNTVLSLQIQYNTDGCATNVAYSINGDDGQIVCLGGIDPSLGKNELGKQPLGGLNQNIAPNALPPKFRVIKTFPRVPFFEEQTSFYTSGIDLQWEIIAFGPAFQTSSELPVHIKQ